MACNGTYACGKCAAWLYGEKRMIEITPTRSDMISKLAYDEDDNCMTITFAKGGAYKYKDVPKESFDALCNSESMGKYFHANIKPKFTDVEKL